MRRWRGIQAVTVRSCWEGCASGTRVTCRAASLSLPPPLCKNENSCNKGRTRPAEKDTATDLSLLWKRSDCCALQQICSVRVKDPTWGRNLPATWLQPTRGSQGEGTHHSCGSVSLAAATPWGWASGEGNLVDQQRPQSKCLFRSRTQFSMCRSVSCPHLRGALGG